MGIVVSCDDATAVGTDDRMPCLGRLAASGLDRSPEPRIGGSPGLSHRSAQLTYAEASKRRVIEPQILGGSVQWGQFGVVAPRERLPTSGDVVSTGHVGKIHERLLVVTSDLCGFPIPLVVLPLTETHPIAEPPVRALGNRA